MKNVKLAELRRRCEDARLAYIAAAKLIDQRLRVSIPPTAAEWEAEERARTGLAAARAELAAAVLEANPNADPAAFPSCFEDESQEPT